MKKYLLMALLLLASLLQAQNLVLNSSYEQYSACPTNQNQVPYSVGWDNYAATPDYYNACATFASQQSVPHNCYGSYQPASTGNAYCGFYTTFHVGHYSPNNANLREIIGRQLFSPMIVGTKYYASIKVSLACNYATSSANCATNNIGIKFCKNPANYGDSIYVASPLINNFAHIYDTSIITDTTNWTIIKVSIIADSAYDYILISNFFDSAHTDTMLINPALIMCRAYYYLDDVCVSTDSVTCDFSVGINENKSHYNIEIYPNPFSNFTTIILSDELFENEKNIFLSLYDIKGTLVRTEQMNKKYLRLNANGMADGIYFVQIKTSKQIINKKLIITN